MGQYAINLSDAIFSLSDVLDLVGVTHLGHGKRVGYIVSEVGHRLGWDRKRLERAYFAAVLHDCGVSHTYVHKRLMNFECDQEVNHCNIGAKSLASCSFLTNFSSLVLHHHTLWKDLSTTDLSVEERLSANCIFLADRTDALTRTSSLDGSNILINRSTIREQIESKRDDWFCGQLVDAFLAASVPEAFWLDMEEGQTSGNMPKWISRGQSVYLEFEELRGLVGVFSQIVDAKSPFTSKHSTGVALLARYLGVRLGLSERSCEMLELGGLLHDLGKLRVPDEILEKNGPLTAVELAQVQRHSYDSLEILKKVDGLQDVALWAGQHHERLDGSGYPYRTTKETLSIEARIIAISDIFQALAADRPYRKALPLSSILDYLRELAVSGKIDAKVVECICAHPGDCLSWAVHGGRPMLATEQT